MDKVVTGTTYRIEMTLEEWDKRELDQYDSVINASIFDSLYDIPGIQGVEYNGHFGPNVFLHIYSDEDTEETWDLIWAALLVDKDKEK